MRFLIVAAGLLSAVRAASWSFTSAKIDIGGTPYPFTPTSDPVTAVLPAEGKFKLLLTTLDGEEAKRPHQAMLLVKDSSSSLEANLVITTKSNGRGTITVSAADLGPHLTASGSVDLTLVVASFGESTPLMRHVATLAIEGKSQQPPATPVRYGALPEITHTFRPAQTMPPTVISYLFSLILAAGFLGLIAAWYALDVNVAAARNAFTTSPIAYGVFIASLLALEGSLFLYWTQWRIMQALGTMAVLAIPAFFSGRVALREVEKRRLAGSR